MIILHSKKIIFVHVSKCAGMWVSSVMKSNSERGDYFLTGPNGLYIDQRIKTKLHNIERSFLRKYGKEKILKHSFSSEIKIQYPNEWSTYRSFAVVRDPVDRVLSMVRYARECKVMPANKKLRAIFEWMRRFNDPEEIFFSSEFSTLSSQRFFSSQADYICDGNGKVVVSDVLYQKNLARSIQKFLHVPANLLDQKINVSSDGSDTSPKVRARIEDVYRADIDLIHSLQKHPTQPS